MIPGLPEYERYIYSLPEQYPAIQVSTPVAKRTSATSAQVTGTIYLAKDVTLRVLETIDFIDGEIVDYSYEARQGSSKLYWYDCWPHPDDPSLASTNPHHRDVPPDIRHHRVPAPELSASRPNLTFLLEEISQPVDKLETPLGSG